LNPLIPHPAPLLARTISAQVPVSKLDGMDRTDEKKRLLSSACAILEKVGQEIRASVVMTTSGRERRAQPFSVEYEEGRRKAPSVGECR
jgi:hypothetical protein